MALKKQGLKQDSGFDPQIPLENREEAKCDHSKAIIYVHNENYCV